MSAPPAKAPLADFSSDTATRPTDAMRRFMCEAEVGDEQKCEDPTVNALLARVCRQLGKDAAIFLPSGTMCNEVALAVHCRRGDEVLMDRTAHALNFEAGGPAVIAGAIVRTIDGHRGVFTADQVRSSLRPESRYAPRARLLVVEQTSNLGGGTCWPLDVIEDVCGVAHSHGLVAHLDGARLFNAVIASGVEVSRFSDPFDSVWVDFSKGLGAPMGAVLAGSEAFIDEAWRWKQRLGGALRQAGIAAAACIYALDHHVERIAEDHANAQRLARGLATIPGVSLDLEAVQTNIVLFDIGSTGATAEYLASQLIKNHAVRASVVGRTLLRMVTHLNASLEDAAAAVEAVRSTLAVWRSEETRSTCLAIEFKEDRS